MTAYIIADIDVHDEENYQEYVRLAPAHIERHGGTYRIRGGNAEACEGDWCPTRFVVIEFPSKEQALALLNDSDYQEIAHIRRTSTTSRLIIADGI